MVVDEAREHSGLEVLGERLLVATIRAGARFLRGSFTAGCVCAVRDPADRLLLVKPRYRLDWGLPGGFLRRTEQAADAIRRGLEDLGRGSFEQLTLTSAHGRMVFVNLGVGYLVVITKMEMRLGQVLIEVESAARRIKGLNKRI